MSAVERLQAAIDKLETLKTESTQGPWLLGDANGAEERVYAALWVVTTEEVSIDRGDQDAPEEWFLELRSGVKTDADLIVTLHRTIDAQLAILRGFLSIAELAIYSPVHDHVLALADAVLGSDS